MITKIYLSSVVIGDGNGCSETFCWIGSFRRVYFFVKTYSIWFFFFVLLFFRFSCLWLNKINFSLLFPLYCRDFLIVFLTARVLRIQQVFFFFYSNCIDSIQEQTKYSSTICSPVVSMVMKFASENISDKLVRGSQIY